MQRVKETPRTPESELEREKYEEKETRETHVKSLYKYHFFSSRWSLNEVLQSSWCIKLQQLMNYDNFVRFLYRPTDCANLGVTRALFGFCMVLDIVEERGLADIDIKWGDPMDCHFPLIHGMKALPLAWMIILYSIMWLGAFGIMLGFHFKLSCASFVIPYWYIFLLDKSYWNNHTYLYGIVATLLWGTGANKYFALDKKRSENNDETVPYWNYFILKFQFFALYFLAGLKKSSREWLEGYAMTNLSRHWVFDPFKIFLSTEQIDFLIIHWFGFLFDLTVGFWMLFEKTRIPAMIFCTAFHLMNSRLFSIGMFPYVCLATMPLFCSTDWPRKASSYFRRKYDEFVSKCKNAIDSFLFLLCLTPPKPTEENVAIDLSCTKEEKQEEEEEENSELKDNSVVSHVNSQTSEESRVNEATSITKESSSQDETSEIPRETQKTNNETTPNVTKKQKIVVAVLLCHIAMQFFLPYSHFVTKGYNNWVPGLYGYSWDMMVHSWETILVVVKVHDNINNEDHYLDPDAWVQNDRWTKHGDMARQYAFCLRDNLMKQKQEALSKSVRFKERQKWSRLSSNLSIYIDVWCSLNGRFQQRVFNPHVDMLTAEWHPFKAVSYLMPLLTQYNSYRYKLDEIQRDVYSWSNYTDVLFIADFPRMRLENYISNDFNNVSLTILEGEVTFKEGKTKSGAITLSKGSSIAVKTEKFHEILTISSYPACYMYIYANQTKQQLNVDRKADETDAKDGYPIVKELNYKIDSWTRAFGHLTNAFFNLVYDVPMVRRIRVKNN